MPETFIRRLTTNLMGYRLLAIQNRLHNIFFSPLLWPCFQYGMLAMHTIMNLILIRAQSWGIPLNLCLMLIFVQIGFFFFEKNCFETAAKIYVSACNYRDEIGNVRSTFFRKVKTSLRPIRIEVSACYYFKTSTFVTYENALVDYTIDGLLAVQ